MKLKIAIILLLLTGSLLFCEGSFDDYNYESRKDYESPKEKELKKIQESEWKSCHFDSSFKARWDLFASEECAYQYYEFSNRSSESKYTFMLFANRWDGKIEEYNGTYSAKYNDSNNSGILELTFSKVFVGIKDSSSMEGKWQDIDIHKKILFRTEGTISQYESDDIFSFYFFDITDDPDFPYEDYTLYDMDRLFSKIYPNQEIIKCTAKSAALRYGYKSEYYSIWDSDRSIDPYYSNYFKESLEGKYLLTYKRVDNR